mmetsp:Transcript_6782/g.15003  ORF Transcript_6782/g.15003 Transcript_6782/m.15003 type:complete len:345 (-) Transcript_6782:711-1745(-)|eukprot:CAMPEP_0202901606 /NCGR_PEP_ID=MMETSP1392-20130828/14351_1 /ASSEMBLY_ACC=CAM_ASM_000868 /TAXON_ID=225041 /ORGANISM="Chlamydomonas chlamydogama, Strain SAG 11-48b" /LENGTH=344 /DNA_ID=CAMNT_0049588193 /DNA_START=148 /DNA_END=1182 /DNA_ORIENTATION=+
MADSSDDDALLVQRRPQKQAADQHKSAPAPAQPNHKATEPQDAKPKSDAAHASNGKANHDSDSDMPIGALRKTKPAGKAEPVKKAHETAGKKADSHKAKEEPRAKKADVKKEPVSPKAVKKEPVSPKAVVKREKAENGAAPADKKERIKKEYDMPGQTRDTPPETDSLRKFYTSLLQQRADSDMARKWCLQHGLLDREEAEEYLEKLGKKGIKSPTKAEPRKASAPRPPAKRPKTEAPAKRAAGGAKAAASEGKRPRAKVKYEDFSDDDSAGESSEEEEEEDEPMVKKQKGAAPPKRPAKKVEAKPAAGGKLPKNQRDVAFADGGLGDSDEEPIAKKLAPRSTA